MKHLASSRASYLGAFAASALGLAAWAQPAVAQQTVFGTNFDGYVNGGTLSGNELWTSNDLYTGASYNSRDIGQSEQVTSNPGYATSSTDYQPYLGGKLNFAGGALPGHATSYIYRPFNLGGATTMQFSTDFSVSTFDSSGHDSFGFTFQSGNGASNLFSVNFVPTTTTNTATDDNVTITSGGVTGAGAASIKLGSRYKLTVNVNIAAGNFTVLLQPETPTGTLNGSIVTIPAVAYAGGAITDVAATWTLANTANSPATTAGGTNSTAYTAGGNNTMLFDNYLVTVPEPSTWALLGAGGLVMVAAARRRAQRLA